MRSQSISRIPSADVCLEDIQDVLHLLTDIQQRLGDVVRIESKLATSFLVSNPVYIEQIFHKFRCPRATAVKMTTGNGLLSSEGEFWRQQRGLLQDIFKQDRVSVFQREMVCVASTMLERWRSAILKGQAVDVVNDLRQLTLNVVTKTLLSIDAEREIKDVSQKFLSLSRETGRVIAMYFNHPMMLDPEFHENFSGAIKSVDEVVYRWIDERRLAGPKRDDVLSRLIDTPSRITGEPLTDKNIRDEIVTLMLAGQDTTANMLGWVLYFVASVPGLQGLVQDEVDRVLKDRSPRPGDLTELRFLKKVMFETLRLIPTVWIMSAQTERVENIGGYEIPGNATILMSPYVTHRMQGNWSNPDEFDAERFEQDYRLTRPRYAYFPFGGGRHRCLGEWFAMMEGATVIAAIMKSFNVRFESEPRLKPFVATTLQPDPTDTLVLEERSV